jgi:hypothetical protein
VSTTIGKINQVKGLMAQAELVRVSPGEDGRHPSRDIPATRIVVRGGNPALRESLGSAIPGTVPEFPTLREGEFELVFGDGSHDAQVRYGLRLEPTLLEGNTEDPDFQRWLVDQVFEVRLRTKKLTRADALHCTPVVGEGTETQWTAIFEPRQVGMGPTQRGAVAGFGE